MIYVVLGFAALVLGLVLTLKRGPAVPAGQPGPTKPLSVLAASGALGPILLLVGLGC